MNQTIETMMERRTIRKYTDRPVTDETMRELYKVIPKRSDCRGCRRFKADVVAL